MVEMPLFPTSGALVLVSCTLGEVYHVREPRRSVGFKTVICKHNYHDADNAAIFCMLACSAGVPSANLWPAASWSTLTTGGTLRHDGVLTG